MLRLSAASDTAINIQEKPKTRPKKRGRDYAFHPDRFDKNQLDRVEVLAHALQSDGVLGETLRVLIKRLHYPERLYSDRDLEVLLTLTLALTRARMWPV